MNAPQTVLILPPLRPDPVARIARLLGYQGFLAPERGCLLLSFPTATPDGEALVASLSKALRRAEILQVSMVDGYLSIARWRRGAVKDRPQPGLLAQNLPEPVLGLAHGSLDPATLPQARPIAATGASADHAGGEHGGLLKRLFGR